MAEREKVCRECKRFVRGEECPACKSKKFSRTWKGVVIVNDPENSEIAKLLNIKLKGKYALWVR